MSDAILISTSRCKVLESSDPLSHLILLVFLLTGGIIKSSKRFSNPFESGGFDVAKTKTFGISAKVLFVVLLVKSCFRLVI